MNTDDARLRCCLPTEVWEEVVVVAPVSTQLSLCQVSRLFRSLSTREIYREILLTRHSSIVSCCRTLISNPDAAQALKSFTLSYIPHSPINVHYLTAYYKLINHALRSATELQDLVLMLEDPNFVDVLAHCRFPRLWKFECALTLSPALVRFLNGHPALTYLQLARYDPRTRRLLAAIPQLNLPNVGYYVGSVGYLPSLTSVGGPLRAAFPGWGGSEESIEQDISALARRSGDTLSVLGSPELNSLNVWNLLISDTHPQQLYLDTVQRYLSRFHKLRHFSIRNLGVWNTNLLEPQMDTDFATVTAWGAACPSLMQCVLFRGAGWTRLTDNSGPRAWILEVVQAGRYPEWSKVRAALKSHHDSSAARSIALELQDLFTDYPHPVDADTHSSDEDSDGTAGEPGSPSDDETHASHQIYTLSTVSMALNAFTML
ncbi:hypothetical protein BD779DRAFT_1564136 [Infundibulicybe gibba]|nr:hypothetical protein BD779DRAFT_1564136 [Infundibulicybe gibba]